jgi:hypothetical protein
LPAIKERYFVSLNVFDMLGRKVAELANGEKTAGKYAVQWNASSCASGIYYCELKVMGPSGAHIFNAVNKIMFLK